MAANWLEPFYTAQTERFRLEGITAAVTATLRRPSRVS